MRPLTDTIPKPLVRVCGKTILDHIAEALPPEIEEIVLVVGYRAPQIREHCGESFHGRTVRYVEQQNPAGGTGNALMCAKDIVTGTFLLLNADDIYGKSALQKIVHEDHALMGVHSDTPEKFGVLILREDGTLQHIIEKPKNPPSNLTNINCCVLSETIFNYKASVSNLGEVLVTDMLTAYAQDHPVKVIEQDVWLPIGSPEQIVAAEKILCPQLIDSKS